jgi:flavin reductase (DIM6/NTAB) family NADH-FMN oxidoreductase RutF
MSPGSATGRAPADADDRRRRRVLWTLPTGLYLLATGVGPERNLMTLSWATQVATEPRALAVSVEDGARSTALLERDGVFAVVVLRRSEREWVRRFAKPALVEAGDSEDPVLSGVPCRVGPLGLALPVGGAAWVACRVTAMHELGSHRLVVGAVDDADFGEAGEDFLVLRMEDTRMHYGG